MSGAGWRFEPALPAAVLAVAAAAVVGLLLYSYMRLRGHRVTAAGYLLLRLGAFALLIFMLAGPIMETVAAGSRQARVLLLVDASDSMRHDYPRVAAAVSQILEASDVASSRRYFARTAAETPAALDTSATDLSLALIKAASEPASAVILVTDGQATAGGNPLLSWRPACGKVFSIYPDRQPRPFALAPPAGSMAVENAPGLYLPEQAPAGSEFKVTARVLCAAAAAAELTATLRGPLDGPETNRLPNVQAHRAPVAGSGLLSRQFMFAAPAAGYYAVEVAIEWPGGRASARRFIEITPVPPRIVYMEGVLDWRLAYLRSLAASSGLDVSVYRLYAADEGAEQAASKADALILGGFPETDLPAPLRVAIEAAAKRGAGFLVLWNRTSQRWLDVLSLPGPHEYAAGWARSEGSVRLAETVATALGIPAFVFNPVWQEAWRFGDTFAPWFLGVQSFSDGVGGFSPCWARPGKPRLVFLQDAALQALLASPKGRGFAAAAIYHVAGREMSAGRLRLSLSPNRLLPGGILQARVLGEALAAKGQVRLAVFRDGRWQQLAGGQAGKGEPLIHAIRADVPGDMFLRAELAGATETATAFAACTVRGASLEDADAPANVAMLKELTRISAGKALPEAEAHELASRLVALRPPAQTSTHRRPLRQSMLIWAALLAALAIEWALRTR